MRQTLRRRAAVVALGSSRLQRLQKWALLAALLPSLTFMGHWTPRVDIPGTNLYLGLPESPVPHSHSDSPADGHDHQSHCHADAASCSDVPFAGASAFALLAETVAFLGTGDALVTLVARVWRPSGSRGVAPEPRPPRGGIRFASPAAGA